MTTNRGSSPPFSAALELEHSLQQWHAKEFKSNITLPGHPRIELSDMDDTIGFVLSDIDCPSLNALEPYLWLISTPRHDNITPLHRQRLRGRQIIPLEDPDMHLVWRRHEIFVKPLPAYLLSHAFWEQLLLNTTSPQPEERQRVVRAAMGLLRTYASLIRHPSDFRIAKHDELELVPKDVSWEDFSRFIAKFHTLSETHVCARYQKYGELRYSRLNILVKLLFLRWNYCYILGDYQAYFERFYGPILFVFAVLSVMLNAMQVELAVESLDPRPWTRFWQASRGFAVCTLILAALLTAFLVLLFARKILSEALYAAGMRVHAIDRKPRRT